MNDRMTRRKLAEAYGLWPTMQERLRLYQQSIGQRMSERNYDTNESCSGRIAIPDLITWCK